MDLYFRINTHTSKGLHRRPRSRLRWRPPTPYTPQPHTHTIIFLHGRGSNALEFCSEIFESQDTSGAYFTQLLPSVKWVFPCAKQSLSNLEREEMHQWFDMTSVQNAQADPEVQRPGLEHSRVQLLDIIEEEARSVSRNRIFLAGISQGCAVALYTLLSTDIRISGFFGLCGWLPSAGERAIDQIESQRGKVIRHVPILLQHCEDDRVVPIANGRAMRDRLEEMGTMVEWQQFEAGGHWLNEPEGMDGIVTFLRKIMLKKLR